MKDKIWNPWSFWRGEKKDLFVGFWIYIVNILVNFLKIIFADVFVRNIYIYMYKHRLKEH